MQQRYLMTHSLLSSWLYALDNPYEDATTERDPMLEFLQVLHRQPTETTKSMQYGIDFENLITALVTHDDYDPMLESEGAQQIADIVSGGCLQVKASKEIMVRDMPILLYGRLDALKAGTIYDIKFSRNYERGKFFNSTQHPMYMRIVPEAQRFTYLVSNGNSVWSETYIRDEIRPIEPMIYDFFDWLDTVGLTDVYRENWVSL